MHLAYNWDHWNKQCAVTSGIAGIVRECCFTPPELHHYINTGCLQCELFSRPYIIARPRADFFSPENAITVMHMYQILWGLSLVSAWCYTSVSATYMGVSDIFIVLAEIFSGICLVFFMCNIGAYYLPCQERHFEICRSTSTIWFNNPCLVFNTRTDSHRRRIGTSEAPNGHTPPLTRRERTPGNVTSMWRR